MPTATPRIISWATIAAVSRVERRWSVAINAASALALHAKRTARRRHRASEQIDIVTYIERITPEADDPANMWRRWNTLSDSRDPSQILNFIFSVCCQDPLKLNCSCIHPSTSPSAEPSGYQRPRCPRWVQEMSGQVVATRRESNQAPAGGANVGDADAYKAVTGQVEFWRQRRRLRWFMN